MNDSKLVRIINYLVILIWLFISVISIYSCDTSKKVTYTEDKALQLNDSDVLIREMPLTAETKPSFPAEKSETFPVDPEIRTGKLQNGLTYYLRHNGLPQHRAEIRLVIKSGSVLEEDDQIGAAQLIKRLAFTATEHFGEEELQSFLRSGGVTKGAELNAYSGLDETAFMLQLQTDVPGQLKDGMLLLRDWAGGLEFDPALVEKEKAAMLDEMNSGKVNPGQMTGNALSVVLQDSKYAERIKKMDAVQIKNLSHKAIQRFYAEWYRPELMAVVVVGDVDIPAIEKQIKLLFSDLINPDSSRRRPQITVPGNKELRTIVDSDKEEAFTFIQLMYKHTKRPVRDLFSYRQVLVRDLFISLFNARLEVISEKEMPPFIRAAVSYGASVGTLSLYTANILAGEGMAEPAIKTFLEENERIKKFGFSPAELDKHKRILEENAAILIQEKDSLESAFYTKKIIRHFLDGEPLMSSQQHSELLFRYLPHIKLSDVNKMAVQLATEANGIIAISGPEKDHFSYPPHKSILQMLEDVKAMDIMPWEDQGQ